MNHCHGTCPLDDYMRWDKISNLGSRYHSNKNITIIYVYNNNISMILVYVALFFPCVMLYKDIYLNIHRTKHHTNNNRNKPQYFPVEQQIL